MDTHVYTVSRTTESESTRGIYIYDERGSRLIHHIHTNLALTRNIHAHLYACYIGTQGQKHGTRSHTTPLYTSGDLPEIRNINRLTTKSFSLMHRL